MGFWGVMKRMVEGKPAFEAPKNDDVWEDEAPTDAYAEERQEQKQTATTESRDSLVDENGVKQPPVAAITNVKTDGSGQYVELWATVRNQSQRELLLDKVTLLGTQFAMNYPLSAGSQRVFRIYKGPQLNHDNYKKAELYYKDVPTGDYFRADHLIQYKYDADGTYEVNDFELITPIFDV